MRHREENQFRMLTAHAQRGEKLTAAEVLNAIPEARFNFPSGTAPENIGR